MLDPRSVMGILWIVWVVSWIAAAFWADRATARASLATEATYRLVLVLGYVALFSPYILRMEPLIWWPGWLGWAIVALAAGGFAICWWARLHLGRLWSGTITRKADHKIIDTGPYAFVRHPIYTGILIAGFAAALIEARLIAGLGAAVAAIGFYQKARYEEGFLRQELGEAGYNAYAARVPMLVPFWPAGAV